MGPWLTCLALCLSVCLSVSVFFDLASPLRSRHSSDVVKTRVQAAQAEYVSRQTASSLNGGRCGNENCHQCAAPQGRTYTTSARATLAGFDGTATSTARLALEAATTAAPPPRERVPALPTGTVAALMHIARWEGPRGLYRGLDASLVMAIPSTVLYYTVYDDFLARLEKAGAGNLAAPATAGSSARLLATVVMAPLELVRTRAQSHGGGGPAAPAAAQRAAAVATGPGRGAGLWGEIPLVGSVGRDLTKVFQEEGMAALWRGVGTTMWRDVPFSMVYWLGYENLKSGLGCGRKGGAPAASAAGGGGRGTAGLAEERGSADFLLRSLVAGAVSGMVASLLTHPFDVVKTQRQVLVDVVPGEFLRFEVARRVLHEAEAPQVALACSLVTSLLTAVLALVLVTYSMYKMRHVFAADTAMGIASVVLQPFGSEEICRCVSGYLLL